MVKQVDRITAMLRFFSVQTRSLWLALRLIESRIAAATKRRFAAFSAFIVSSRAADFSPEQGLSVSYSAPAP
jgi:hypothetical protein